MCGVAGVWGENAKSRVAAMLPLLEHRGPDGHGVWDNAQLALGHTRLAINDLSNAGRQPMSSDDGIVTISVNGEIYNYHELRAELENEGCIFRSHSDSEVVIHAWQKWGEKSFVKFNGMFAISLYDNRLDKLFLVRDRLGIKPLYYSQRSGDFSFSSELKALIKGTRIKPDYTGLYQYLTYQNYFANRTLVEGYSLLKPGSYLCYDGVNSYTYTYWELDQRKDESLSFDEVIDRYRATLDSAVQRHLLSDVPIASYISAGFDSSTVAQRASALSTPPVTFTGAFTEGTSWYDEDRVASAISRDIGSEHVKVNITAEDLPRVFDRLIYSLDEPRMGMGAFPQYCVAEKVAQSHKVVLTGHGGDELFSGYPVFKLINALYSQNNSGCLAKVRALTDIRKSELPHLVYFMMAQLRSARYQQFLPVLNGLGPLRDGILPEVFREFDGVEPHAELLKMDQGGWDKEEVLYNHYLRSYLNGLLVVEDKISMAHSIESRTPMLDNELLDLSLMTPQSVKINSNTLKAVIKEGGKGRLHESLYQQPKRGFPTPLRFWLRSSLKSWSEERIAGPNSALRMLFKEEWLENTFSSYQASLRNKIRPLDEINSHRMWQLLSLESWLKQYAE